MGLAMGLKVGGDNLNQVDNRFEGDGFRENSLGIGLHRYAVDRYCRVGIGTSGYSYRVLQDRRIEKIKRQYYFSRLEKDRHTLQTELTVQIGGHHLD